MKFIRDNEKFWKTVRNYFSDNGNNSFKTLVESNTIVSDEQRIAD